MQSEVGLIFSPESDFPGNGESPGNGYFWGFHVYNRPKIKIFKHRKPFLKFLSPDTYKDYKEN